MEQMQEIDTRQFKTHSDWCQFLAARGQLSTQHRGCRGSLKCRASNDKTIVKKVEANND
jgi:hypothetical protein